MFVVLKWLETRIVKWKMQLLPCLFGEGRIGLKALQEKVTPFVCMIYLFVYGWMMDACLHWLIFLQYVNSSTWVEILCPKMDFAKVLATTPEKGRAPKSVLDLNM